MKYAVMVCLDGKDDWIYITEDTGKCDWNLKPVLYSSSEEAEDIAETWRLPGKAHKVKVVTYSD